MWAGYIVTIKEFDSLPLVERLPIHIKYGNWRQKQIIIRRRDMKLVPARKKKIDRLEKWLEGEG